MTPGRAADRCGAAPLAREGKIDYTFVSRRHFSFGYGNVQMVDPGNCDSHACSDHRIFRSEVQRG